MASFLLPQRAVVILTDAQIKALPTTGITLIAAPGSGYQNKVMSATLKSDFSAGAYTNVNANSASLSIETAGGQWITAAIANDNTSSPAMVRLTTFTGAADYMVHLPFYQEVFPIAAAAGWVTTWVQYTPTHFDNAATQIKITNGGSGNLTGGNSANTLTVTVTYMVEPI